MSDYRVMTERFSQWLKAQQAKREDQWRIRLFVATPGWFEATRVTDREEFNAWLVSQGLPGDVEVLGAKRDNDEFQVMLWSREFASVPDCGLVPEYRIVAGSLTYCA